MRAFRGNAARYSSGPSTALTRPKMTETIRYVGSPPLTLMPGISAVATHTAAVMVIQL